MHLAKSIFLFLVCNLMFLSTKGLSQELPLLMGLTRLKLEIANVETTNEIADLVKSVSLKATTDYKLVVVTLKGTIPQPCQISVAPGEFAAIFEHEIDKAKIPVVITSKAITISNINSELNHWVFDKPDTNSTSNSLFDKPGPIFIKVIIPIPKKVNSFFVHYPTLVKGMAVIK